MLQTSTLRPGFLVSLKSSQRGNVKYDKRDVETEHLTAEGTKKAVWETERVIADPEEHEHASQARMLARRTIAKVCVNSAFGLLCPETAGDDLDAAIKEARRVVDEFNATAKIERISVYVIAGRIAPDDVEAVKAINSEVRDLMAQMETGLRNLDAKAVRDAAAQAKRVGQMLSPAAQERVLTAVSVAREAAKEIVRAGEQAAVEIDLKAIRKIDEQRLAFLDLDSEQEIVALPTQGRAVDFDPVPVGVDAAQQPAFQLEV